MYGERADEVNVVGDSVVLAMYRKVMYAAVAALTLQIIGAARLMCPSDPNCVCGGTLAVELNCNIDGECT